MTKRNAPALFSVAYGESFFWDGRAATLEEQAAQPVLAGEEMAADDLKSIEARIAKIPGYRERFKTVFGSEEVTFDKIGMAIATFERSITNAYGGSAFDQFLRGKKEALSDEAIRGLHLFRTDARCLNCHNG